MATGARQCGCGVELGPRNRSGLCKTCYNRDYLRREYEQHRERELARVKAWQAAHPEYGKQWVAANRERAAETARAWDQANADKVAAANEAYRARKLGLFVERVYRSVVWKRDKGICHLCLEPADPASWHLDHVIALLDGGPHCYANTAVSHPACNVGKGGSSRSLCGVRWSEATGAYKQFHDKEYA